MSFPRYPKYKESGVEWLGPVPQHWEVMRLRYLCDIATGDKDTEDATEDGTYPFYVRSQAVERLDSFSHDGEAVLTAGDGAGVGKVFHYHRSGPFAAHQRVYVLTDFRQVTGQFLFHYLRENFYKTALEGGAKSTVDSLRRPMFTNFVVAVPPADEQSDIIRFLDRETAKIDALVIEQQRLIELLNEKRQAVISHTVTKGLNAGVDVTETEEEWLGAVPSHWELRPIKQLARMAGRIGYRGYTTADIVDAGVGAITLSPSNMVGGDLSLDRCTYVSWEKYKESPEIMVAVEDIVLVKTGSTFGKTAFVASLPEPATINPQLLLFKQCSCVPKFLFYLLSSERLQALFKVNNSGSTIPTMSQEVIGDFKVPVPPRPEQAAIVAYLDAELSSLDGLIVQAQQAITLLQERRSALISAVVTGQIDVRDSAARSAA